MNVRAWREYRRFYRGHLGILPLAIVSAVAQAALLVPVAFLVQRLFDSVLPAHHYGLLALIGAGLFLLYVLSGGLGVLTRYLALRATKAAVLRLRHALLAKVYALPRAYLDQAELGRLHATIVHDSERVDIMSNALLALLLPAAVVSLALCGVLIYLDPILFVTMLVIVPPLLLVSKLIGSRFRERLRLYQESFQTFSGGMLFVLQMLDLTRIQGAEPQETARQAGIMEDLRDRSTAMAWMQAAYMLGQNTIVALSGVIVLLVGGAAVATGSISLGQLLSFYVVLAVLRGYAATMSMTVPQVIAGQQSLRTLDEILRLDVSLPYQGGRRLVFEGTVRLDGVTFGYDERDVLHEVTVEMDRGSIAALVGPNGSGKSTIMSLILGLYRPRNGEVRMDGVPMDELDVEDLRKQIGVVMQAPAIFTGTVRDNIVYGWPDAGEESVRQAAELATADEFIRRLPLGYETLVGENGHLLSGGQLQRIALARALLRRPALLLLDEPTNHLDRDAVRRILYRLVNSDVRPAVLLISHDDEAVSIAHRVYRLEEGRVVDVALRELLPSVQDGEQPVGGLLPGV